MSSLTIDVTLTSVNLFWSPPEQHNGILTHYEVTYRVYGSNEVINVSSESLSTTIKPLTPDTRVVDISVSAYTNAGRGQQVMVMEPNVVTLARPRELVREFLLLIILETWKLIPLDDIIEMKSRIFMVIHRNSR